MIPLLGFLITCLLFFNLYLDDGYVLVRVKGVQNAASVQLQHLSFGFEISVFLCVRLQEAEKRQLGESLMHPGSSERYVHTFRDLSNFSGAINVTYRYLAGIPLPRKSRLSCYRIQFWMF